MTDTTIKDALAKRVQPPSFAGILSEAVGAALRALDNPLAWECPLCKVEPQRVCEGSMTGASWRGIHYARANYARQQLLGAIYQA